MYKIIYDYTDENGDEFHNLTEYFDSSWFELQEIIQIIRSNGGYNIIATFIGEY